MNLQKQLGPEWYAKLDKVFDHPTITTLGQKLELVKDTLCPSLDNVFRAYELVQPSQLRVLVLGQDPYPTPGVADGLAFSYLGKRTMPKSLKIVFNELKAENLGERVKMDLSDWASQGVMLLNTVLTTEENKVYAHRHWGWDLLIAHTLKAINELPQRFVVLAWGTPAQEMVNKYIAPTQNHLILKTCHPMAQDYSGGRIKFIGCNHFTKANEHLGDKAVKWV